MTFAVNELLTCILNCDARLGLHVDCKSALFFANASDGPYSNKRLERVMTVLQSRLGYD